jgi:hypothetical protein
MICIERFMLPALAVTLALQRRGPAQFQDARFRLKLAQVLVNAQTGQLKIAKKPHVRFSDLPGVEAQIAIARI